MRRTGAAMAVALVLAGGGLAAGCFDTGPVYRPTGAECTGQTPEDASLCEGGVCLVFSQNKQNMSGVCSADCGSDTDCHPHETCISIQGQPFYCLRTCATDADCFDDFVCRVPNAGAAHKICIVDPG